MKDSTHENRLKSIEAECTELRRQILKLEFQSKKDAIEARRAHEQFVRDHEQFVRDSEERWQRYSELREQTRLHLNHLSKLTGIAFDDIFEIDDRLEALSKAAARKRQRSE